LHRVVYFRSPGLYLILRNLLLHDDALFLHCTYICYSTAKFLLTLLGRLLRVDLIKWISNVRRSIRTSSRPQKVFSISMKFGMSVEVNEWCMTVCSMTWSKVKVTGPGKSEFRPFSKAVFRRIC